MINGLKNIQGVAYYGARTVLTIYIVLGIHNFGFSLAPFYWLTPPFGSFAIGNSGTTAPCCKNGHNSIVANIIAYLSMPISAVS